MQANGQYVWGGGGGDGVASESVNMNNGHSVEFQMYWQ